MNPPPIIVQQPPQNNPPPPVFQPPPDNRDKQANPPKENNPPKDVFPPNQPPKDANRLKDLLNKDKSKPLKDQALPPGAKEYVYSQSTGQLRLGDLLLGTGFSGSGNGRNNPKLERMFKIGPIPAGDYTIGNKFTEADGAVRFELKPMVNSTNRWPREVFWMAADTTPPGGNPASYITLSRDVLSKIEYQDNPKNRLKVVP
jgi:hypothetical protein